MLCLWLEFIQEAEPKTWPGEPCLQLPPPGQDWLAWGALLLPPGLAVRRVEVRLFRRSALASKGLVAVGKASKLRDHLLVLPRKGHELLVHGRFVLRGNRLCVCREPGGTPRRVLTLATAML